jgi:hypothetical protein
MVIRILDIASGADTSAQGTCVFAVVKKALSGGGSVVVSFDGVQTATPSFVNTALVDLLNDFSYDDLKARLRVTNSTRQINDTIKTRLDRSANRAA